MKNPFFDPADQVDRWIQEADSDWDKAALLLLMLVCALSGILLTAVAGLLYPVWRPLVWFYQKHWGK